jgi:hypothetical protein
MGAGFSVGITVFSEFDVMTYIVTASREISNSPSVRFVHPVVVKCSIDSGKHIAYIFRVIRLKDCSVK